MNHVTQSKPACPPHLLRAQRRDRNAATYVEFQHAYNGDPSRRHVEATKVSAVSAMAESCQSQCSTNFPINLMLSMRNWTSASTRRRAIRYTYEPIGSTSLEIYRASATPFTMSSCDVVLTRVWCGNHHVFIPHNQHRRRDVVLQSRQNACRHSRAIGTKIHTDLRGAKGPGPVLL